jgi:polyisoprenoid-binding protein YceI
VVNYPASTLLLTSVRRINSDSLKFSGNLCIREVTKSISFFAHCKNGTFKTRFIFNRHDWNIAYKGSWVNKTLVDSDVELTIELVMQ